METLIEFAPLLAFLVAYKLGGIYVGVAVLMAAMAALLLWRKLTGRPISAMLWGSTALAFIFGTATLVLHDARFIQMKPTIFYWLLALVFMGSHFVGSQPLAQRFLEPAMGKDLQVASRDWRSVNLTWIAFWLLLGAANIYVVRNFSEAAWVNFKVIGTTATMFVFMIAQVFWLSRRAKPITPVASSSSDSAGPDQA
jgi:intracellular septation protein